MITRKKFLALSSLGAVSLLFPNFLLSKPPKIPKKADILSMLREASFLRKNGKLEDAKRLYYDILKIDSNEIRAYDGLRKILLSGYNPKAVIDLLEKAVKDNPGNVNIKQRLYREYFNAALGNKKLAETFGIEGRLLENIQANYESFLKNHSNPANVSDQLTKIKNYVKWNVDTEKPHTNVPLKKYRKEQYQYNKNRFKKFTTQELNRKLDNLLSKPNPESRRAHIRELYELTIKGHRKEKRHDIALELALNYHKTFNRQDPLFIKYIRDLSRYHKKYDVLIGIETQNHATRKTFWSGLALFDAYFKKVENDKTPINPEMTAIMSFLKGETLAPSKKFEYATRLIKLDVFSGQLEGAKNKILEQTRIMYGITNAHSIDRINVLAATYYAKTGNEEGKKKIVKIVINPKSYLEDSDSFVKSLAIMNMNRDSSKIIHLQNLQKLIDKL
ncbi:tetratricopeptide repeat protein [Chryseobacterium sp. IT-36CA2]|uniref:tetratricopeptide repeat protein n=1 Tax=Chryseobacterium sp. IT-36CA2 TaxID=3026460 RepID=UPI0039E101A3